MQKGPLTGYVPDFSEYVLELIPLPRPVPPGRSVGAPRTFTFKLTNPELAHPETHDAVVIELGIPRRALLDQGMLSSPSAGRALPLRWSAPVSSRLIPLKRPDLQMA